MTRIDINSAIEMQQAALTHAVKNQIFIACAAVADFRPAQIAAQKMKKQPGNEEMAIQLVKNPDIVANVAALTNKRPFTVGFAAETQNVEHYARGKLAAKNLDLICANDVSVQGQGFNSDTNALHLYWPNGDKALPLTTKADLGQQLVTEIVALYQHATH